MSRLRTAARTRWQSVLRFLIILGPGVITAMADNDAPGITTYSLAGAQFGNKLLWALLPTAVILIVMQDVALRTGVVTRKALADLIRENFGIKLTFFLMVAVLVADLGTTCAEFAGLAAASEIFGVSRYLAVPLGAFAVWWLVVRNAYRRVEKVLLVGCGFYVAYIISGILARPDWGMVLRDTIRPTVEPNLGFIAMLIAMVGTTVAPWQQFYMQSTVVDKGITAKDYRYSRLDVIAGYIFTVVVAFFIVAACSKTLFANGIPIEEAADAAIALEPLAGKYASTLFGFGLLISSVMAAAILPLSTAYVVCEGMGWEHGVDHSFGEAPEFYTLYTGMIVLGALLVLTPHAPLVGIMFWSQVICGFILPAVFVLELIIVNRRDLMGEWVNSRSFNVVAWVATAIMIVLNLVLVFLMLFRRAG
jgi:NRAMP (natural resistance-associated macrophage protein)-like metal ion transporter